MTSVIKFENLQIAPDSAGRILRSYNDASVVTEATVLFFLYMPRNFVLLHADTCMHAAGAYRYRYITTCLNCPAFFHVF